MAKKNRPLKSLSFNKIIPNIVTLLALSAGLTSIRFGLRMEWEHAVIAVMLAAVFDGIDGRIARMLKGTTKFGAELDSLADVVSFGVAPAVVLYMWSLNAIGGIGWALSLLLAVCCALRLARFNTMVGAPDLPSFAHNYFTGVPAPAGAFLALLPMCLAFEFPHGPFAHPVMVGLFVILAGGLMVSQIPTYSFKRFRVPANWVMPLLIIVALLAAFMVTEPWATLGFVGLVYLAAIPFAVRSFRTLSARARAAAEAVASTGASSPVALLKPDAEDPDAEDDDDAADDAEAH